MESVPILMSYTRYTYEGTNREKATRYIRVSAI